ncbi:MAG: PQQ-like beta-propeller repeat protein [Verrucomicrobia bacterium]|nr:PQQ-like beta-propeller repeat protein [Verrucomicrobiota bacterium]
MNSPRPSSIATPLSGWVSFLRGTVLAAGFICAVVGTVLALNHRQSKATDPLNSPVLLDLVKQAQANPVDSNLVAQVRAMDLLARRAFFTSQSFAQRGAWLLLAGAVLVVAALRGIRWLQPPLPVPGTMQPAEVADRAARNARISVSIYGALLAGALVVTAMVFRPAAAPILRAGVEGPQPGPGGDAPTASATTSTPVAVAADFASDEEMLAQWPAFRGFRGLGGAAGAMPTKWNGETGDGILWKVATPRQGFSSAVVWKDRIFVTGADDATRELYCLNAADGSLRWRHAATDIPGTPAKPPRVAEDTGLAPSTAATDGRRVFAIFGTGDLIACDLDGKRIWAKNLGSPKNPYGHASSLMTHRDLLIVQYDQEKDGLLLALRTTTGEIVWQARRVVQAGWSSPIVFDAGGKALIAALANPMLAAYDPADGSEVWRLGDLEAEIGVSPAAADGRVFGGNEYARIVAADAKTGAQIWETDEDMPDVASPLPANGLVFLAASSGILTCRDAASGAKVWMQEFDEGFYSSPMAAGGLVHLTDRKGITRVFKAARTWDLVSENPLGEDCTSTPAFVGGRIYLRGMKHLFAIGSADAPK